MPSIAADCAIEINDVQPLRTGIGIAASQFDRIGQVAFLAFEIAFFQAHDAAADEVDGGEDNHAQRLSGSDSKKFFSKRDPTAAERSG